VPLVAEFLRLNGLEVFDDWYAAGPHADDAWRDYERTRGHRLPEALKGYAARHVFAFDSEHLHRAEGAVLVLPAGKSAHLEFGWILGRGKRGVVLLDEDPDRYDVMYQFAHGVTIDLDELYRLLKHPFGEGPTWR